MNTFKNNCSGQLWINFRSLFKSLIISIIIMKTILGLILTFSLLLFSCDSVSTEKAEEQNDNALQSEHQHEDDTDALKLDNGNRWMVNEEMKPFILESKAILDEFSQNNSTDYQTLAAQLKEKNSGLIKSCTMKGKSHDELHKWLHPHMDLIESLAEAENLDAAKSSISQLNASFETYHQYFQ